MGNSNEQESGPTRLLRTPEPFADESLMGYVLRLTEENGYDTPKWIFDVAGLSADVGAGGWPALYGLCPDLGTLGRVLGLEGGEFVGAGYNLGETGGEVAAYDSTLPKGLIRFQSPKLCPACLRQASYHRGLWDLLPFTACPEHGLVLVDRCGQCGGRVRWSRRRVSYCRCGADMRAVPEVKAGLSTLNVSSRILQLCAAPRAGRSAGAEEGNPLFELDLGDFCRALTLVADNHLFLKRGRGLGAETDNISAHEAYALSFRAFSCWPRNFYEHLDGIRRRHGRAILNSRLFHRIHSRFDKRELHFAVIALEDYVEKNEWKDSFSGGTPPPIFRQFIAKKEACRRLGVSEDRLGALVESQKLRLAYRWQGSEALVDGKSIEEMRERLGRLLPIWVAAKMMCAEPRDVEDLVRQGCLIAACGPGADGQPEWRFEEHELHSLLRAIGDRIVDPAPGSEKELVGSTEVITRLRRMGVGVGRFTRDVLDGDPAPAGTRKLPGLAGFLFQKEDVSSYLSRLGTGEERQSRPTKYKLLARALAALLEKEARVSRRGVRGREAVSDEYDIDAEGLARSAKETFSKADQYLLRI